jgi:hypothetical protein
MKRRSPSVSQNGSACLSTACTFDESDTDIVKEGGGSHSARSMRLAGIVMGKASDSIIEKGRRIAAQMLETAEDDIVFTAGRFTVKGTDRVAESSTGGLISRGYRQVRLPAMVSLRAFSRAAMVSASGKRSFIGSIYALQSHSSEGPLCRLPALRSGRVTILALVISLNLNGAKVRR